MVAHRGVEDERRCCPTDSSTDHAAWRRLATYLRPRVISPSMGFYLMGNAVVLQKCVVSVFVCGESGLVCHVAHGRSWFLCAGCSGSLRKPHVRMARRRPAGSERAVPAAFHSGRRMQNARALSRHMRNGQRRFQRHVNPCEKSST